MLLQAIDSQPSQSQPSQSYVITPAREDRKPIKPKTETDYGIDDANSDDSSEDEGHPKKMIPEWAQREFPNICTIVKPN